MTTFSDRTPRSWSGRFVAALLCATLASTTVVPAALAEPTASDLETARDLFKQGNELKKKGDLKGALDKFKAADALAGTPITGVELGRTYMDLDLLLEAREAFLGVARLPVKANESPNTKDARAQAAKLADAVKARIPSIHVVLSGVDAGATPSVTIDGVVVPPAALTEPRKLDPGLHVIVAKQGDGPETSVEVTVAEGENKDVPIEVKPAPKPIVAAPATIAPATKPEGAGNGGDASKDAGTRSGGTSSLTYIGFGVAGVGVLVGSIAGFVALGKTSTVKNECSPTKICPAGAQSDIDSSRSAGTVSSIAFTLAGIGAAVGVVGLLIGHGNSTSTATRDAHESSVSLWVGVGSAGLAGAF